jgi:hypothetical protein
MIKYLDGWQRINDFTATHDILVGPEGHPFIGVATNQPISRWQIHPDAPLGRIAQLTGGFTEDERIEIWTSQGIFIVGAPLYGGRRLPGFGKVDLDYRVQGNRITKNGKPWTTAGSPNESACRIFDDLSRQPNLGFVNLYFEFSPSSSWVEVETVICNVLPSLDAMRGLWVGPKKDSKVILHFHDIWRKEWERNRNNRKSKDSLEAEEIEDEEIVIEII